MSSYGETIVTADRIDKIKFIQDMMRIDGITVAEISLSYEPMDQPDPTGRDEVEYTLEFYKYVPLE